MFEKNLEDKIDLAQYSLTNMNGIELKKYSLFCY